MTTTPFTRAASAVLAKLEDVAFRVAEVHEPLSYAAGVRHLRVRHRLHVAEERDAGGAEPRDGRVNVVGLERQVPQAERVRPLDAGRSDRVRRDEAQQLDARTAGQIEVH